MGKRWIFIVLFLCSLGEVSFAINPEASYFVLQKYPQLDRLIIRYKSIQLDKTLYARRIYLLKKIIRLSENLHDRNPQEKALIEIYNKYLRELRETQDLASQIKQQNEGTSKEAGFRPNKRNVSQRWREGNLGSGKFNKDLHHFSENSTNMDLNSLIKSPPKSFMVNPLQQPNSEILSRLNDMPSREGHFMPSRSSNQIEESPKEPTRRTPSLERFETEGM